MLNLYRSAGLRSSSEPASESHRFDASTSNKQSFNLVMAWAERPRRITAGKFVDLDLGFFFSFWYV